ncbi:MAG: magnesium transporter [Magnetococcales bacterium]|nr:magnesium transporter [Magnetococcales bacterium]
MQQNSTNSEQTNFPGNNKKPSPSDPFNAQENHSLALPDYAETILRLFRKHSYTALQKVLSRIFPSDLARILDGYSEDEAAKIFFVIPSHRLAASTLKYMGQELRNHLMQEFSPEKLIPILEELPPDDRADIIGHLDSSLASRFMGGLDEESMREVADLLQYDSDTAGGLMTPDFFALTQDATVGAAIETVRSLPYIEMVFYLYVLDDRGRLVGVSSLRQLIVNDPNKTLAEIMTPRIISVATNTPSSEVAEMVKHYRLLGVPVVDDMDVLVGVVTVDDVISTMEQDLSEDVLKMPFISMHDSGVDPPQPQPFLSYLPWLLASMGGGILAGGVITSFMILLNAKLTLAVFIPLVMTMVGDIRKVIESRLLGLTDFRETPWPDTMRRLLKELGMVLGLGSGLGLIGGVLAWLFFHEMLLAQVVGLTILFNVVFGATLSVLLFLFPGRLRHFPKFDANRTLNTLRDVIGILIYFLIAKMLLGV